MTVVLKRSIIEAFTGIVATDDVSLRKGARHALIGPNGAGKTTLVNLLTGVLEPTEGQILLEGTDITHLAPHQRARRGMVRTFQINQLFDGLTPLETIGLAVSERRGQGPTGGASSAAGRISCPMGRNPRAFSPPCHRGTTMVLPMANSGSGNRGRDCLPTARAVARRAGGRRAGRRAA